MHDTENNESSSSRTPFVNPQSQTTQIRTKPSRQRGLRHVQRFLASALRVLKLRHVSAHFPNLVGQRTFGGRSDMVIIHNLSSKNQKTLILQDAERKRTKHQEHNNSKQRHRPAIVPQHSTKAGLTPPKGSGRQCNLCTLYDSEQTQQRISARQLSDDAVVGTS